MPPDERDVAVVGAGPAGALAAMVLARRSGNVVLIDRDGPNREKTCGHCLNPKGINALTRLGVRDEIVTNSAVPTHQLRIHFENDFTCTLPLTPGRNGETGRLVPRRVFDQSLIELAAEAGAEIVQSTSASVKSVGKDGSHLLMKPRGLNSRAREFRTRLLIGADGVGSSVARAAGFADRHCAGRRYGFSFDLSSARANTIQAGVINMFLNRQGYLGLIAHSPGELHLAGLVGAHNSASPIDFVNWLSKNHALLKNTLGGVISPDDAQAMTAVGPIPWRPHILANESVVLVGDAAGYAEPFTGEGMAWAIQSAGILEEVLSGQPLRMWNQDLAADYTRAWRSTIGRSRQMCSLIGRGLRHPRLLSSLARLRPIRSLVAQRLIDRIVRA